MNKNWIQGAIKHPGAFTKQAKKADMGVQEFARHVGSNKDEYSETTNRRAALARRLKAMNK
jgi:hypothetical protein